MERSLLDRLAQDLGCFLDRERFRKASLESVARGSLSAKVMLASDATSLSSFWRIGRSMSETLAAKSKGLAFISHPPGFSTSGIIYIVSVAVLPYLTCIFSFL